jgi:BlaI family transcriptional regulator, penicillinase repressor
MKKVISITEAEAAVMEVLWVNSPTGTDEIIAALSRERAWHESTVKTLIGRLAKKGAIRAAKDNRRRLYSPVVTRDEWLSDQSTGLLDRLFGGRVAPLVAHFSRHRKLSRRDIADLKRLIQELDDES